jgi:peptide/nickel transport system substrate-binding protein
VRYRVRALTVGALALGLAIAGCSKNSGSTTGNNGPQQSQTAIVIDTKGTTPTPAAPIAGAQTGGTIYWLEQAAPDHMDPQQGYVTDEQEIGTLLYRELTYYIEPINGGPMHLVGDLATNTGVSSNGGKTWTYTLRDGLKFEDGSAITSKDIAYGIARSFGDQGVEGPQYVQNALDPNHAYKFDPTAAAAGTYPPGLTTPDAKTIVFNFPSTHPEMPYLASMQTTTPVPAAKDDGAKYDFDFVSSGPYMRQGTYSATTSLTLVKNPNWDPNTDAIRHQYPDKYVFDFTPDRATQTQRLLANQGNDQYAVSTANVANGSISQVQNDPALLARTLQYGSPFVDYVNINTTRVTDLTIRKALEYAFPRADLIKAEGGSAVAAPATTIMATVVPGYKNYNAYPSADGNGDIDQAKKLLNGQTPHLTYCFAQTTTQQTYAAVIQQGLQRAGFVITLNPIPPTGYYTAIGHLNNTCDMMRTGWGQDYPDGDSTLRVLLDGNLIKDGASNYSQFNNADINKQLEALQVEPDRVKAATEYGALDQNIMTNYAPLIPWDYIRTFSLMGSKVGGAHISNLYDEPVLADMFAKS